MKYLHLILVLLFAVPASAEVYVLVDKATGEVISAIEQDIAVVEPGWEKKVLPGTLKDYGLTKHPTYYKLDAKGDFIQDNAKISKEANDKAKAADDRAEQAKIYNRAMKLACESLKAEGVSLKIDCESFK